MGGTPNYTLPGACYVDKYSMPKLSREIKMLVNGGVMALYVLQDNAYPGATFVLYDENGDAMLLDNDGGVVNHGKLGRYPVKESVNFPTIRVPYRTRK